MKLDLKFRPWQEDFLRNMRKENAIIVARRSGKSWFCIHLLIMKALLDKSPGFYIFMAKDKVQVEDISWKLFEETLKYVPGVKLDRRNLRIRFEHNGAEIALFGGHNIESRRGLSLSGLVIDEAADCKPDHFFSVLLPALADKNGWYILSGTPKTGNWFEEYYHDLKRTGSPDRIYTKKLDAYEAGALDKSALERLKETMPEAKFALEMLCDTSQDVSDKYFLELINRAEEQDRVGEFSYDPKFPVYCSFDLGRDATSVWFAQCTKENEWRLIDFWEETNSKLEKVFQMLHSKGYIYKNMILPHDATQTKINAPESIYQMFRGHGFQVHLLKRVGIEEGIAVAQNSVVKCRFDRDRCREGLNSLRNYHAEVDQKTMLMTNRPKHDKYSHAADSFRYLCLGLGELTRRSSYTKKSTYIVTYDEFDY